MIVKGFIYKIITDAQDGRFKVYIGSTSYPISYRLSIHEYHYRLYQEKKFNYLSSFDILKHCWYNICLVEEFEYENIKELHQKERDAIEKYKADSENYIVVNANTPLTTNEEKRNAMKKYQKSEKGKKAISKAMKKYYQKKKALKE